MQIWSAAKAFFSMVAALSVLFAVVVVVGVFKDRPLDAITKTFESPAAREKFVATEEEAECLARQMWHPSHGKSPDYLMAIVGRVALNFRKDTNHNLCVIFTKGLAEMWDVHPDKSPIVRSELIIQGEIKAHGRFANAKILARSLLDGTLEVPKNFQPLAEKARCATRFVRSEEGMLFGWSVKGGLAAVRSKLREEFKAEPVLTVQGYEFFGACRS